MSERLEGLRARKRRETGERIEMAAVALFLQHGFEATTLDAIAAAADVSRRTVFHYFPSKEAIVEAQEARYEAGFRDALAGSTAKTPLAAALDATLQGIGRYETEEAIRMDALMRCSPQLMAKKPAGYLRKEEILYAALVARWPDPARASALRLTAMAAVGAFRLAAEAWSAEGGVRPLAEAVTEQFALLKAAL